VRAHVLSAGTEIVIADLDIVSLELDDATFPSILQSGQLPQIHTIKVVWIFLLPGAGRYNAPSKMKQPFRNRLPCWFLG
jgi:hypothetical protein